MRKLIIAMTALAAAAPLAAQPNPHPRDRDIVGALPHPGEIDAIGRTMGDVTDAILDVDIGPVVDAVEGRRHDPRRHRETLGDIASRDDPYARERIRDDIGLATVGLGAAMEQLAVLTPVFRRSIEDAARRMEDAIARGRRGRDRDYDRDYDRRYDPDRNEDYDRR